MATLAELYDFHQTVEFDALSKKISVACAKKAYAIGETATPTAAEVTWAKSALENPDYVARIIVNYVLAANADATITQITSATDETIETNVGSAVDKLLSL